MNTVKQAQELAKEIKQTFSEHSVILLHSRLLMADRAERESDLLCRLGKRSAKEQRPGLNRGRDTNSRTGRSICYQTLTYLSRSFALSIRFLQTVGTFTPPCKTTSSRFAGRGLHGTETRTILIQGTKAVYGAWLLYRTLPNCCQSGLRYPMTSLPLCRLSYQDGDQVLPAGDPAFALWQKHQQGIREKERKAQMFRIPDASALMETIHGLLDSSPADSDWVALASVRDGEPSLDVLVLEQRENGEEWPSYLGSMRVL